MKPQITSLIASALESLIAEGIPIGYRPEQIRIDPTKNKAHGDFACNIAMMLAKQAGMPPRVLAEKITSALPESSTIKSVEIAGPGFINFFVNTAAMADVIHTIEKAPQLWGRTDSSNKKIQIEYVSANPTGPLHVGHGRGAAYGAALANLLKASGIDVQQEYYVNDAGRQMDILATSTWLRHCQTELPELPFPSNGYQGDYVKDIASSVTSSASDIPALSLESIMENIPADAPEGDKEAHIDALIERAKSLLGENLYRQFFDAALDSILGDIQDDLKGFGVQHDAYYSERSLSENNKIDSAINKLTELGHTYEKEGAIWFKSTEFGDDKDRVLVRDNGITTYFASDVAYHCDKFDRGFDEVVNVWGADHHGYIPRVKAALTAMGYDASKLTVLLVQFANLYRGEERVQMSTRSGSFVTLRELREDIGKDAARFFYVLMRADQHMDFDLELATSSSKDNPLYYIQYAHARICTLLDKAKQEGTPYDASQADLNLLSNDSEQGLLREIGRYPEVIQKAASKFEPNVLVHYLKDLCGQFHTWYANERTLVDEANLRNARLALSNAVRITLQNGLELLDVTAPSRM